MAKVFYMDAYSLGLLYVYVYSNKKTKIVKEENLRNFYNTIESNLENSNSKVEGMYATLTPENEEPIYFTSEDENNDIYYILRPDINLKKVINFYSKYIPTDIFIASMMNNSLDCLNLEMKDAKIKVKENKIRAKQQKD